MDLFRRKEGTRRNEGSEPGGRLELPRGISDEERKLAEAIERGLSDEAELQRTFAWMGDAAFRGEVMLRLGDLLGLSTATVLFVKDLVSRPDSEPPGLRPEDREPAAVAVEELVPALRRHNIRPGLFGLDEQVAAETAAAIREARPAPEIVPDVRLATASSDATEIARLVGLLPADMRQAMFKTSNRAAISVLLTALLSLFARSQELERREELGWWKARRNPGLTVAQVKRREAEQKAQREARMARRPLLFRFLHTVTRVVGWVVLAFVCWASGTWVLVTLGHLFS